MGHARRLHRSGGYANGTTRTPEPFQGEVMTCALCGKREPSDPGRESQWRYLAIDGKGHHVCTDHFPPDGASVAAFQAAYTAVLRRLIGAGR
jgi:hypothetical protein